MTVSRHRWRNLALVVAMFGLMSAGIAAPAASADDSGTTLSTVADTQIKTFNPFLSYYDGELDILGMIYPTLNVIDKDGNPGPYLADSWTSSADQLTWTFKIHSGLKWSDGQPLTAKDAAWTFNLIMTNDDAATANGSLVSNFASVTAPDDTTLVIKTKQPQANMLYVSIPTSGIPIVPQHVWEAKVADLKNYTNMDFPVVGYGPYTLVGNVTNQYATLNANKDFFLGAPKYDTLISRYFANSDAAVAALKNGELTQMSGLTAAQFTALQGAQNIQTYQQQASGWNAIEVNSGAKTRTGKPIGTGNPLLQDKTVRQAIALAIDRQQLVTKILDGHGVAGSAYIPPTYTTWAWSPTADQSLAYNPDKANQILDAAGYKKGADGIRVDSKTGKPLTFRYGIHSDDATDAQVAPYIQEWLKAVGIGTTVQPMSFDQLNDNLSKGDWDMLMDGWSTGYDPTYLLSHPDVCNASQGRRHRRQHRRVLLRPGLRQAVRQAGDAVRHQGAGRHRRADAVDPLRRQRRHHPVLQELARRTADRQGVELPVRFARLERLLPAAEPLLQLDGCHSGGRLGIFVPGVGHRGDHRWRGADHRGGGDRPDAAPRHRDRAGIA